MALTFITAITQVSSNLATAFITDATVYGGANPQRSELALYGLLYKRDASDNDTAISIDNSDPLNVVQWAFDLASQDGNYVFSIWAFSIWSAGTYNADDAVYNPGDGAYYKALTTTTAVPGTSSDWDLIIDFYTDVPSTVEQGQTYNWSSAHSESGPLADALADLSSRIRQGKCANWQDAAAVITGAAAINGAFANFRRADYVNAQKDIDYVQAQTAATL